MKMKILSILVFALIVSISRLLAGGLRIEESESIREGGASIQPQRKEDRISLADAMKTETLKSLTLKIPRDGEERKEFYRDRTEARLKVCEDVIISSISDDVVMLTARLVMRERGNEDVLTCQGSFSENETSLMSASCDYNGTSFLICGTVSRTNEATQFTGEVILITQDGQGIEVFGISALLEKGQYVKSHENMRHHTLGTYPYPDEPDKASVEKWIDETEILLRANWK